MSNYKYYGRNEVGKICNKCRKFLPWDNFIRNQRNMDGHRYECKACFQELSKKYRRPKGYKAKPKRKVINQGLRAQLLDEIKKRKMKTEVDSEVLQYVFPNLNHQEYRWMFFGDKDAMVKIYTYDDELGEVKTTYSADKIMHLYNEKVKRDELR